METTPRRAPRIVYQFPISHFCEKTRWNLDAKRLRYVVRDMVPGLHIAALRRMGAAGTVPVLVDGDALVADSSAIAEHLDRTYPERPLVPREADRRERALELERWFGARAGVGVRQWMYGQLAARPGRIAERLFATQPARVRLVGKLVAPLLERAMRRKYRLDVRGIAEARRDIGEALDRLERETNGDPTRFLVGDELSIADITAASLLGPLVAPAGSPWAATSTSTAADVPAPVLELRAELEKRPAWAWVQARYARDRRP
jgi:glutathione S-transferase